MENARVARYWSTDVLCTDFVQFIGACSWVLCSYWCTNVELNSWKLLLKKGFKLLDLNLMSAG